MDMKKIGRFIAELRREKGLTQQALADKLFVTAKTISRWENGNYAPPIDALPALAEILGTTADELLSGERAAESPAAENGEPPAHQSRFSLDERVKFYRKKWLREHLLPFVLIVVGILITMTASAAKGFYLAAGFEGAALLVLALVWRNRMMSYIEKNAYDGNGSPSKEK